MYFPTEEQLINFVTETHLIDHIHNISHKEVNDTWKQKIRNPFAHGHFWAINYLFHEVLPTVSFPCRSAESLVNIDASEGALCWLKETHRRITEPLVNQPVFEGDNEIPTRIQIGKYRMNPVSTVLGPAPSSEAIPYLMHVWLKDITEFHHKVKPNLDNPYGFNPDDARKLVEMSHESCLFFSIVQPMSVMNHRLGRIVELALRTAWRLPFKLPTETDHKTTFSTIQNYSQNKLPKLLERTKLIGRD